MDNEHSVSRKYAKSLSACWREGIGASVMIGITDYFLIPMGLFLGASSREIGFLVALPHLLGSFSQLLATHIVRRMGSRSRFLVRGAFVQASLFIPIAFLAFIPIPYRVTWLITLVVLFRILGNLLGTVWGSLVSDYLSARERGRFLGWRSQVTGLAGVAGIVIGGVLLYSLKKISPALGFFVLFILTAASRFASTYYMARMEDVPLHVRAEDEFTFFMFVRRFRESNFVKFVLYVASITFATNLAAPYFSVFMLRDLELNYLAYMAIHLAAVVAGLVSFPIWGRHADMVGNAKVLITTSFLIPIIPILWLFVRHWTALVAIELFAGFVWGGFNLCAANFIFDAVMPEKRVRCLSYFSLINGTALFLGASIGGYLAEHLPPIGGFRLYTLFLISALLRLASHFFLSRQFREVRATTHSVSSAQLFFSVVGLKPLFGREQDWNLIPFIPKPSLKSDDKSQELR